MPAVLPCACRLLAQSPLLDELDVSGCERLSPNCLVLAVHPGRVCFPVHASLARQLRAAVPPTAWHLRCTQVRHGSALHFMSSPMLVARRHWVLEMCGPAGPLRTLHCSQFTLPPLCPARCAAASLRHALLARSGACCDEAVAFLVDRYVGVCVCVCVCVAVCSASCVA